jgi:hypothetical protein
MNIREDWIAYRRKERAGFDAIFAMDVFEDWDICRLPEVLAEDCLGHALDLRYGQDKTGLSDKFLERSLDVVARILAEQRFSSGAIAGDEPSTTRGKVLRVRTFANALLGRGFDPAPLCDAAPEFATWALFGRWDDHSEDAYLLAVRLLLIAGDVEKANQLLKIRKKFKWHGGQVEVFRRLVDSRIPTIEDHDLKASFDAMFDPFRPRFPASKTEGYTRRKMTRIELGAIRDKYFVSPTGEIDWDRTIDAISR